ncbi:glycosyltransferase family 2 protein [Raineyella fluvialis]
MTSSETLAEALPPFAVVIVHYRDRPAVQALIAASVRWTVSPREIVVVDNSGDFEATESDRVFVASMGGNLGYGPAVNEGVRIAVERGFEFVLVLTQDCSLEDHASAYLLKELVASDETAIAAPCLCIGAMSNAYFLLGAYSVVTAIRRTKPVGSPFGTIPLRGTDPWTGRTGRAS